MLKNHPRAGEDRQLTVASPARSFARAHLLPNSPVREFDGTRLTVGPIEVFDSPPDWHSPGVDITSASPRFEPTTALAAPPAAAPG